ncbi:MAG TPA: hypothetical protein PL160_05510 [Candidatus Cloacimonas sp.]|nr:hypothetical protein [Candidatus Cloacimonas sp.]
MYKLICISLLLAFSFCLMAQTPQAEAIQSLESAKKYLQEQNYPKAQDEINYASSKISEILSEMLVKYLPEAPAGYKLDDKSAQGLGSAGAILGSANAVAATGKYLATAEDEDGNLSELTCTISMGGILGKASGLAALGQMFSGYGMGTTNKTIRVAGYNGTQEFSGDSGTLTVQVGEKISVIIEGSNIQKPEIMKTLAEKIDLAKLEKAF